MGPSMAFKMCVSPVMEWCPKRQPCAIPNACFMLTVQTAGQITGLPVHPVYSDITQEVSKVCCTLADQPCDSSPAQRMAAFLRILARKEGFSVSFGDAV